MYPISFRRFRTCIIITCFLRIILLSWRLSAAKLADPSPQIVPRFSRSALRSISRNDSGLRLNVIPGISGGAGFSWSTSLYLIACRKRAGRFTESRMSHRPSSHFLDRKRCFNFGTVNRIYSEFIEILCDRAAQGPNSEY